MTPHHPQPAATRDLVVAVSPFEEPHPAVVTAAERAGALGLLDLGRDAGAARRAFAELARRLGDGARYGVRVPAGCPLGPGALSAAVDTVLLADPASHTAERVAAWAAAAGRPRVWAEVTDAAEAVTAVTAGADALVAKGHEGAAGWARPPPSSCSSSSWATPLSGYPSGPAAGSARTRRPRPSRAGPPGCCSTYNWR